MKSAMGLYKNGRVLYVGPGGTENLTTYGKSGLRSNYQRARGR